MSEQANFHPTRWSLIAAVRAGTDPQARQALETLCQAYWYPLYAYARRSGQPPEDAADLTQGFFAHLVEKDILSRAIPERGRLRNFLLASMNRFIRDEWRRQGRVKRGGGQRVLSLDRPYAAELYAREPAQLATPESLYHRRWALTLLDRTLVALQDDYAQRGKGRLFELLKPKLTETPHATPLTELAQAEGIAEGTLRVALCRLRSSFRLRLVEEVAAGLESPTPEAVDEEINALFRALE